MINAPGVYDIPADEYHADPCPEPSLSSSIAKLLVSPGGTPRHAWETNPRLNPNYVADESDKFDLGNAAHSLVLRDPQSFAILEFDDFRSRVAKAARDAARAEGKIPLLAKNWDRVRDMARAARCELDEHHDAHDAFTNGKPEQTLIWREDKVWCRARLDWLPDMGPFYDDYKSTSASADPDLWDKAMMGMGFDFQAAFYLRGIRALGLWDKPVFRFVVQENYAPFALSVVALMPGALDLASRDVEIAIRRWSECLAFNSWPGYPKRTCYIDSPPWREAQKMAREVREHDASQADIRRAADAQAPL